MSYEIIFIYFEGSFYLKTMNKAFYVIYFEKTQTKYFK